MREHVTILARCERCGRMFAPKYPYGKRPTVCYRKECRVPNHEGKEEK